MKIIKIGIVLLLAFFLTSCVVAAAAKVVTTAAKIGISAVKGTVKGVSWAVKKAEGKIDEDRLNGTWKVVGVYNGTYEQFSQDTILQIILKANVRKVWKSLNSNQKERNLNRYIVSLMKKIG